MKRITIILAACMALTGCAGKRYDSTTKISSETTIQQDATAPVKFEAPVVPLPGQTVKQTVGGDHIVASNEMARSLNGRKLIEVKFIRKDGSYSVLEVMETGERFKVKGSWGEPGDQFKIER